MKKIFYQSPGQTRTHEVQQSGSSFQNKLSNQNKLSDQTVITFGTMG